jgi:cell division protein FtsW (lipid II flippase)
MRPPREPGERLLAACRLLFGAASTERWLEPLVADVRHEWRRERPGAARERSAARALWSSVPSIAMCALRAGPDGVVWTLAPMIALAVFGLAALSRSAPAHAPAQALWLAIALVAAALAASLRWRGGGHRAAALLVVAAALPVLATGSRWLALPGLVVMPLELALPALALALAADLRRGLLLAAIATAAALFSRDVGLAAVLVSLALAAIGSRSARARTVLPRLALLSLLALALALALAHALPVPLVGAAHVDSAALAARGALGVAGVAALGALQALVVVRLARSPSEGGPARSLGVVAAQALASRATLHVAALVGLAPRDVAPWPGVSYGGSTLVAALVLVGLVAGARAQRPSRRNPVPL